MSHSGVIVPFLCVDVDTVFTLGSVTFALVLHLHLDEGAGKCREYP